MKIQIKENFMRTRDNNYIPDILETIANLSNDEVFTPPKLANDILDLLPKEIWKDSTVTFLDPAVKTGIFLREIARRLIEGLADEIPDLQKRVNHILTKQVFGLAITELTALMSRRTVYCAMEANSPLSVCTEFTDAIGNIKFPDTKHSWNEKTGRCEACGASRESYDRGETRESYAYPFIHNFNIKETFGDMKFDVIIGNPPYQLNVGNEGGNSAVASAIYHYFVDRALELNPKYITMIIPSRWMSRSAKGIPDEWIDKMISDNRIREIHDFLYSENCFDNVNIRGGVNYFLWDSQYNGKCDFYQHSKEEEVKFNNDYLNTKNSGIVVRDISSLSILDKVLAIEEDFISHPSKNFSSMVSAKGFFTNGPKLQSSWKGYSNKKTDSHNVKYYMSSHLNGVPFGWVKEEDIRNKKSKDLHKIYIAAMGDSEEGGYVIGKPMYGEPNSVCSITYLTVGYDSINHNFSKEKCLNIMSYMKTKFFRFMVKVKRGTQLPAARGVYQFVPLQDFSKPWTDDELYKKYGLTEEEIAYIEDNIAPMTDDTTGSEDTTEEYLDTFDESELEEEE